MLQLLLLNNAFAGYYNENWELTVSRGDGVAVISHVMANTTTANYHILYGSTAERCVYTQSAHNSLYAAAASTAAVFLATAETVMPACWDLLGSSEKSAIYPLYQAMRGSGDGSEDWTLNMHRVVPNLVGYSDTFAQADFLTLRSAAETGFSAFNTQATSLLVLSPTAWGNLSAANQAAIHKTFDWIDGD